MRRLTPILVWLCLAALAAVALGRVGGAPRPRAAVSAATGAFGVSNSRDGQAIFAAAGVAPGAPARGEVTVAAAGSGAVRLLLRRGALTDAPGPGGGLLSERLRLSVVDVSTPAAPRTVYAGPLASMPDQALGPLDPGEPRTFEFTATLPGGLAPGLQNAVQGASTTVAYSWIARQAPTGGGAEGNGAEPGGEAGPAAEGHPGGATPHLSVSKIRSAARGGRLLVWVRCAEPCRLEVRGRLLATAASRRRTARLHLTRRLPPGTTRRLRIAVPRRPRARPARARLQARLRFVAIGAGGDRDVADRTLRIRPRGRHAHRHAPRRIPLRLAGAAAPDGGR